MMEIFLNRLVALQRHSEVVLGIAVVGMVLMLIIPLPPFMLDFLLSISILISITTLLATLYAKDVLAFSSFPSLLLFITVFRLSLNIASTRMILSDGQAGDIINTFGAFVTGGSQLVGLVIFSLLTIINFVVITKGSGRVAEVAARFTLDAMPGKQMAIDADLNAGVIDDQEAKNRRQRMTEEADFYGSMDGASKFVRGDAIAGIIITLVNILGGFTIGMFSKGMGWHQAAETYMILAVGDGLVTQIPALLISVGAGIIVTRSSSKENLGNVFQTELFNNPRVLWMTAFIMLFLGFMPGMPLTVMFPVSLGLSVYGYALWKQALEPKKEEALCENLDPIESVNSLEADQLEKSLYVDPMEIEFGYGLTALVDTEKENVFLLRINLMRQEIAKELGFVVPAIAIRDNPELSSEAYQIKIKGVPVAESTLYLGSFLAMNPGHIEKMIPGVKTTDPIHSLPSVWIGEAQKEDAELHGYEVLDAVSVLIMHLGEVVRSHAHELINRQEVKSLVDNIKPHASAVIEELIPNQISLGVLLHVLQNLLRERIPIRDLITILESLADYSIQTKDPDLLTEYVRQSLSRTISKQCMSRDGKMFVITLDSRVEQMMLESVEKDPFGSRMVLRPLTVDNVIREFNQLTVEAVKKGVQPAVLTIPQVRPHLRRLMDRSFPHLPILSVNELEADVELESLGVLPPDVLI